jgi:UDPglucose 6-dehydrogenase
MIIGMPVTIFRCSNLGKLIHIYRERFPATEVMLMTSDESEAVKLIQNSFFAVKVAFWNEARSLADVLKLRWDVVMNGILSDGRISPSHTRVPGPDGKRGFGGECLPKDLASLSSLLDDYLEVPNGSIVCKAALRRNEIDRMSK